MTKGRAVGTTILGGAVASSWWNGITIPGVSHLGQLFLLIALVPLMGGVLVERRDLHVPGWLLLAGALLLVSALLTALFPPDPAAMIHAINEQATAQAFGPDAVVDGGSNFGNLLKLEVSLVVAGIAIVAGCRTMRDVRWLADCWAVGSLINAAVAVTDAVTHVGIGPLFTGAGAATAFTGRQQGLSEQPNHLAVGCLIVMPLVSLWLLRPQRNWRRAGGISLVLLAAAILASGSRSALVAFPVCLFVTFVVIPPLRPAAVMLTGAAIAAVILILALGDVTGLLSQTRIGSTDALASDQARSLVRGIAVGQFESNPVSGSGFTVFLDAHDIFLQLLAAGGIIALSALAVVIGGVLSATARVRQSKINYLGTACLLSFVAWLLIGTVENNLADLYVYVPVGLIIAMQEVVESPQRSLASLSLA